MLKGLEMNIKELLVGIWKVISFLGKPVPPGFGSDHTSRLEDW